MGRADWWRLLGRRSKRWNVKDIGGGMKGRQHNDKSSHRNARGSGSRRARSCSPARRSSPDWGMSLPGSVGASLGSGREAVHAPDRRRARTLADLFDGRSQLIVYHFMFGPAYEAGCPACSSTADSFNGVLSHLKARDVTMICVSRAPIDKLLAYRERMGWSFNWASSHESDFNFDYGVSAGKSMRTIQPCRCSRPTSWASEAAKRQPAVRENLPLVAIQNASASGTSLDGYFSEGHGISTFAPEGNTIYHCYSSYARGTEFLMGYHAILDRAPKGRGEGDQPMSWLRRHDEYDGE